MTVSFFINKNDLQELNYLVDNFSIVPFDEETRDKAVVVECFTNIEHLSVSLNSMTEFRSTSFFIQVNVEYKKYDKIREYLKF